MLPFEWLDVICANLSLRLLFFPRKIIRLQLLLP